MFRKLLLFILLLAAVRSMAQVPAAQDTTFTPTASQGVQNYFNIFTSGGINYRLPYIKNVVTGKVDFVPTSKYLRAFYLAKSDTTAFIANILSRSNTWTGSNGFTKAISITASGGNPAANIYSGDVIMFNGTSTRYSGAAHYGTWYQYVNGNTLRFTFRDTLGNPVRGIDIVPNPGNPAETQLYTYNGKRFLTTDDSVVVAQKLDTSVYTRQTLNAYKYGVVGDSTAVGAKLSSLASYLSARGGGELFVPSGVYLLETSIKLPDNVWLHADVNARFTLANGANTYMVRNADIVNGNKNVKESGGKWNGNGKNQTITITDYAHLSTDNYGFGFLFSKVDNASVENAEIDSTTTWGVAHLGCTNFSAKNMVFHQRLATVSNNDGITGTSKYINIDNVRGYTNDDLVSVIAGWHNGFLVSGFPTAYFPNPGNIEHANISNITPERYSPTNETDSAAALNAVRISNFLLADTLKKVTVKNISGYINANSLNISSSRGGGPIGDIYIDGLNTKKASGITGNSRNYIYLDSAVMYGSLNINGIQREEGKYSIANIKAVRGTIPVINISNSNTLISGTAKVPFFIDSLANIGTINFSNIYHGNSSLTSDQLLYKKVSTSANKTQINVSNVRMRDSLSVFSNSGPGSIALNGTSFRADSVTFSPNTGNVINQRGMGIANYNGTYWENYKNTTKTNYLDVPSGFIGMTVGANLSSNTRSTNTTKIFKLGAWPYSAGSTLSSMATNIIYYQDEGTTKQLNIGVGTSSFVPPTQINIGVGSYGSGSGTTLLRWTTSGTDIRSGGIGINGVFTTGLLKLNGTSLPSIAVAGTDYTTPAGVSTLSNKLLATSNTFQTPAGTAVSDSVMVKIGTTQKMGAIAPISQLTPMVLAKVTGINAKTVANTTIYTVPIGKNLKVTEVDVIVTASVDASVAATAQIDGTTANIYGSTPLAYGYSQVYTFPQSGISNYPVGGEQVKFNLTGAATATTLTYTVVLIGYLF